ncbi:MAG: hypothetical protein HY342_01825 [Candidatus Lambdaproteobacteria bacterium]|nr:hypothetical protein [Candidatus Lambdaproteobacteria bacterium]
MEQKLSVSRMRHTAGSPFRLAPAALLPALVALLGALLALPPAVRAQAQTIGLELFELAGGAPKYRGERQVSVTSGVVTEVTSYRDPAGQEVQHVEAVYREENLGVVSYRARDMVIGREEDLLYKDGKVQMRYVSEAGADPDIDTVDWQNSIAFSPVVVPLIVRNWERLRGGAEVTFDLLVPSRQDTVGFRVRMDGAAELNGAPVTVMRMEPSSWIIRRLVDPMYFAIEDAPSHRVLEFRGRSTIPTKSGGDQDLRMVYRY